MTDEKLLEWLVSKYGEELYNYILVRLDNNKHLAEEALSKTYLVLLEKKGKYDRSSAVSYMYAVAKRTAKAVLREWRRRGVTEAPLEEDDAPVIDEYFGSDQKDSLDDFLSTLTDFERDVRRLYFLEKLSLHETADRLGVTYYRVRTTAKEIREKALDFVNKL